MNWKRIYQTEFNHQAQIVKEFLENHEIHAILLDKKDTSYKLGLCEVYVLQEQVLIAINLIKENISFE